jgi:transcriptional regulator with XRE-family HTH domain
MTPEFQLLAMSACMWKGAGAVPSENLMTPRSRAPEQIGDRLRAWRLEQNLSQSDLAAIAGVSCKTVQRIERGAVPSADTVLRIECALDLPEGSIAPGWDLPPCPAETDYGSRVRARRRALGLSLCDVAGMIKSSTSTLSRFERGISVPRRWFAEWTDAAGRVREAIIAKPLARALRFKHVGELHAFCMAGDVSQWSVVGDRRSALWLPAENIDPGVALHNVFPTIDELRKAHYRETARRRSTPSTHVEQRTKQSVPTAPETNRSDIRSEPLPDPSNPRMLPPRA